MFKHTLINKKYYFLDSRNKHIPSHRGFDLFTDNSTRAQLLIKDLSEMEHCFPDGDFEFNQSFVYCMISTFCNGMEDTPENQLDFMKSLLDDFFEGMARQVDSWLNGRMKTAEFVTRYLKNGTILKLGDLGAKEEKEVGPNKMETQEVGSVQKADTDQYRLYLETSLGNLEAYRHHLIKLLNN